MRYALGISLGVGALGMMDERRAHLAVKALAMAKGDDAAYHMVNGMVYYRADPGYWDDVLAVFLGEELIRAQQDVDQAVAVLKADPGE